MCCFNAVQGMCKNDDRPWVREVLRRGGDSAMFPRPSDKQPLVFSKKKYLLVNQNTEVSTRIKFILYSFSRMGCSSPEHWITASCLIKTCTKNRTS